MSAEGAPDGKILPESIVQEMAARVESATPGPWQTALGNRIVQTFLLQPNAPGVLLRIGETFALAELGGPTSSAALTNAAFIAAARADLPALIFSHEALRRLAVELADALLEARAFAQDHDELPDGEVNYASEGLKAHDALAKARKAGLL